MRAKSENQKGIYEKKIKQCSKKIPIFTFSGLPRKCANLDTMFALQVATESYDKVDNDLCSVPSFWQLQAASG